MCVCEGERQSERPLVILCTRDLEVNRGGGGWEGGGESGCKKTLEVTLFVTLAAEMEIAIAVWVFFRKGGGKVGQGVSGNTETYFS